MKYFGLTDRGIVRQDNQDCFRVRDISGGVLAVVCDGMGGARAGNVASSIAADAFMSLMLDFLDEDMAADPAAALADAVRFANLKVYDRSFTDFTCTGMGSTLVGVLIRGGECTVVNVGDSRAYLISGGKAERLTRDHSLVQDFVDSGYITAAEAASHPKKNIITRAIGTDSTVEADIFKPSIRRGDVLLLCSDGLSNVVAEDELPAVWKKTRGLERFCRELLKLALLRGAPDNVTALAVAGEEP